MNLLSHARFLLFVSLFLFQSLQSTAQLKLNEMVSSNITRLADEDGDYPDWVELVNTFQDTINLGGYTFTDDLSDTVKWQFPSIDMAPGSFQVVFASGKDRSNPVSTWHTIIDKGDSFNYLIPDHEIGDGWKDTGFDDQSWLSGPSGFGYGDNDDATSTAMVMSLFVRKEFTVSNIEDLVQLVLHLDYDDGFIAYINGVEVARDNLGTPGEKVAYNAPADDYNHEAQMYQGLPPNKFEIHGWANILRTGTNVLAIEVHNYSSSSSDLSCIPILSLGLKTKEDFPVSSHVNLPQSYLHTNFQINAGGEAIYLFHQKELVDSIGAVLVPSDISYGRQPDGGSEWRYFQNPTPSAPNGEMGVTTLMTDSVHFSHLGGLYNQAFDLNLTIPDNDTGLIYYTTDGSVPDETSLLYGEPIHIHTDTVIRARAIVEGQLSGPVITNTYVLNRTHSFPVVCLSTNPDNFWDYHTGIYVKGPNAEANDPYFGANFWQDWERPVHFEYYDQYGNKQIDQGAGVKIFGAYSRAHPQKSLSLFARKEYGDGTFNYRFFTSKDHDKYEALVLRNSGNSFYDTHFRDAFMTTAMKDIGLEYQAFQPTAVYINGQYWGVLNMREKINEHFIADNTGAKSDNVNILEMDGETVYGENSRYRELINFIESNSLASDENYEYVSKLIDIDNFIDYYLVQTYIDNRDWPGNNIKYWNTTSIRSRYRWILYDTDFGFSLYGDHNYNYNSIADALEPYGPNWPNPPWSTLLFRKLMTNNGFKEEFVRRGLGYLNSYWQSEPIIALVDSFKNLYSEEMIAHCQRWDLDYGNWSWQVDKLKTFARERPDYYRRFLGQETGYNGSYYISLDISPNQGGQVSVNSITPEELPFRGSYFYNMPMEIRAIPRPGYRFVRWEGDKVSSQPTLVYRLGQHITHRAVFEATNEENRDIVINEVFYKSSDELKPGDWVELYNAGETTVDLEGWVLSDADRDSAFVVPTSYLLAPGGYVVLCKDMDKFKTTYPWVKNVMGELDFGLSGNGDIIRLYDHQDQLIDAVDYYPSGVWPDEANGQGASIELTNPDLANEDGNNWVASLTGGTPGEQNFGFVGTGILDTPDKLGVELYCFPNPVGSHAWVSFSITVADLYQVDLTDLQGRVIQHLGENLYPPGKHTIKLRERELTNLPAGIYIIRLMNKQGFETIKMIKK